MSNSRTKNVVRNVSYQMINKVITILLSFVNRTVFIKVLGVGYLGISGLFSDILMMLSMADLGFNSAMAYSFYKPLAENDTEKVSALVTFYRKIYNVIAFLVAAIGICVIPFFKYLIKLEKPIPYLKVYYLFFLANTVISYLFVYKTTVLSANQQNYLIAKVNSIMSIVSTLAMTVFLFITKNYFVYLTIQVLFTFLGNLYSSFVAQKVHPYIKERRELASEEKKSIVENLKSVFLYKVSAVILNGTDNMLISVIVGTVFVGYYSNYRMFITNLTNIVAMIFTSTTASIGNLIITAKHKKRFEIFTCMQTISFCICSVLLPCFVVLIDDVIRVWLGSHFVMDPLFLVAISLNLYFGCVMQPIFSFREATALYRKTKYIMVMTAVLNLVFSVVLGYELGMAGILLATTIAKLLTYIWYEPCLLFNSYFEKKPFQYFRCLIANVIIVLFITFVTSKASGFIAVNSWMTVIIKAIVCFIISVLLTVLFYRKTEGFDLIKNKAQDILYNKIIRRR